MLGQKHLIMCRCVLPQFKGHTVPPRHQFIVFSVVSDDGITVKPKFAQCNNCGLIHKVSEICKSEIMTGRESMSAIVTIDEIKASIPANLATILETNHADIATWEAAQFIIENKRWGDFLMLSSDVEGDLRQGKYVRVLGENLVKVESFTREETLK